jgi:predicted nucleic acid-binding protein
MSDKVFLDTNILLYAKIDDGTDKHTKAHALRKNVDKTDTETTVRQFMNDFNLVPLTAGLVNDAIRIFMRYQFSYWDSVIVAAALEASCSILYSEDLQVNHSNTENQPGCRASLLSFRFNLCSER